MLDAAAPFPPEFVKNIQAQLGEDEANALLRALNENPLTSLRFNPYKPASIQGEAVPWNKHGIYLSERPSFVNDPLFHAGAYYVQEASSMILEALLPVGDRPLRILDLCAAPGGKSTLLAAAMSPESLLISNEVIFSRAKILAENITRWGIPNVLVTHADPKEFGKLEGFFDLIVVDAPCSGEGMFRKDLNARNEWSEDNVATCALRQTRILNDVLPALAPGGTLIYSTCTFNEKENTAQLKALLETHQHLAPFSAHLPEAWETVEMLHDDVKKAFAWQCFPHKLKGEGLFIGRLRDTGEAEERSTFGALNAQKRGKKQKGKGRESSKQQGKTISIPDLMEAWVWAESPWGKLEPEVREDNLKFFTQIEKEAIPKLQQQKIHIIKAGTVAGKLHRKGLNPSHELALSVLAKPGIPTHELELEAALRYLRKEDLPDPHAPVGFRLATYDGVPVGWLKGIQGKWKNYLPIPWRIRIPISDLRLGLFIHFFEIVLQLKISKKGENRYSTATLVWRVGDETGAGG
jgi:16S rRNA C967 or C1407 C5-methylase (RsmB/RsmF family)/NOL1/NOP2/fmu family ribosome biogenesis protein